METVLLLAHVNTDGSLPKPALEALGAARTLAEELGAPAWVAGFIGGSVQAAADSIAGWRPSGVYGVEGAEFDQSRYATDAAAATVICQAAKATVIIAPATARWNRVLPGVAQRLGGRADIHATGISTDAGVVSINRWYYRQRIETTLQRAQRPWFILVDPGSQPACATQPGKPTLQLLNLSLAESSSRTTVLGIRQPAGDVQTIRPEAALLLVAGAGWTKKQADGQPHVKEAEQLIRQCLELSRASLGSSKSLVDLGGEGQAVLPFLTHLNQVGQTGSTPRHPKGLATCCHGEEPHTVGWRFINERRAINLDPNCGWARGKADVLYVSDAFQVIAKVNDLLGQATA